MATDSCGGCKTAFFGPVGSNAGGAGGDGAGGDLPPGGGFTPPSNEVSPDWGPALNRDRIQLVYQGDELYAIFSVALMDGTPVDPTNSRVLFTITDDRFMEPFWQAGWNTGLAPGPNPGTFSVTIPREISDWLRRGGFMYTITVTDLLGRHRHTAREGYLLVEYGADAPNPDIPYRPPNAAADPTQNDLNTLPAP